MTPRRAVFLTARRELRERVRARTFQISTLVQIAIVVAVVVLSSVLGDEGSEEYAVGAVGAPATQVAELARSEARSIDARIEVERFEDERAARAALEDDEVDAVVIRRGLLTGANTDPALGALLQGASAATRREAELRRLGLSREEARTVLAPAPLAVEEVEGGDAGAGLAFAATLLLYIAIVTFGYAVSSGVVEEKQSRVVELVLSAIRPLQLLAGKIIGIGLVGLLQVLLIASAGIGAALAVGEASLPDSTAATAGVVIVFFLLGYAFYACAYAAAGALVSRQEDAQTTTAPLLGIVVAAYFATIAVVEDPDSRLAVVCTFLPPVAPMVVPARAAQDAIPGWQLALSVVVTALGVLLVVRLAARIYERSILRVGAPVKLREALRRTS